MADYLVQRDEREIHELLGDVAEQIEEGGSRFPGMTYEQGVQASLDWLFGNTEDHPYGGA